VLILTRRVGESLTIREDVSVTVLGVKGNQAASASVPPRALRCNGKRSTSASKQIRRMNFQRLDALRSPWQDSPR
jgi:hypothetical protein